MAEHVALGVAAEEEVQMGVSGDLDERVATRLQGVQPREGALLAAGQEAAVGRPARNVQRGRLRGGEATTSSGSSSKPEAATRCPAWRSATSGGRR